MMDLKLKAITWLVLPEDKQYFHDLAPKEGKQKWKIFNEMRIAFQEKRDREAKIIQDFKETANDSTGNGFQNSGQIDPNGQAKANPVRKRFFGFKRSGV
jgi:hypothetical protein